MVGKPMVMVVLGQANVEVTGGYTLLPNYIFPVTMGFTNRGW